MGNNIEKDIIEKLKKDIAIYQFREENNKKQNKSSNKNICLHSEQHNGYRKYRYYITIIRKHEKCC